MGLIVWCVLFLQLFNSWLQLSTTATTSAPKICRLQFTTVESTFNGSRDCKQFTLESIRFAESPQKLLDSITGYGLESLIIYRSPLDFIYLPQNLSKFTFAPAPGCTTKIIINDNVTYNLEGIYLYNLRHHLPANIRQLRSLKEFCLYDSPGTSTDFTIFAEMTQLQRIVIYKAGSVTLPEFLEIPVLNTLSITDSLISLVNDTTCEFPKLSALTFVNNDLQEIPESFGSFTNLTQLSVMKNKLRRVHLDMFANMKQLVSLTLSNNEISEITAENEVEFPALKFLSLNNNNLTQLNVTLWSMPALQYLSLGANQLKRLPGVLNLLAATTSTNAQAFLMDGNPVDCEWMNATVQQIPNVQVLTSDNNGLCRIYGWSWYPLHKSKTDFRRST